MKKEHYPLPAVLALMLFLPTPSFAQCENFVSANTALTTLATNDTKNLNNYISQEKNFIDLDLTKTATYEIEARLEEFDVNIRSWLSDWWQNRYKPSMKNMTKQLSVFQVDQSFAVGAMLDAQLLNEAIKMKKEKQDEARLRYSPSELACQTTSVGSAQTKASQMAKMLNRGFAKDDSKRHGNAKGSDSATGRGAEIKKHWEEYVAKFCDNTVGDQGCTEGVVVPRPGKHKDLPGHLWGNVQTIDPREEDNMIMASAALRYLIYPESNDPIPPGAVESASGHQAILDRRAEMARTNAIYNVMGSMLGERVGVPEGEGFSLNYVGWLALKLAGKNIDPSYSELRGGMANDRFLNPEYMASLVGTPDELVREQGSTNALRLQLMNDIYRRSEEALFMEAAAYSRDLDKQMPETAVGSAPLKPQ